MKKTNDKIMSVEAERALSGIRNGMLIFLIGIIVIMIFAEKLGFFISVSLGILMTYIGKKLIDRSSNQYNLYHLEKSQSENKESELE